MFRPLYMAWFVIALRTSVPQTLGLEVYSPPEAPQKDIDPMGKGPSMLAEMPLGLSEETYGQLADAILAPGAHTGRLSSLLQLTMIERRS